MKPRFIQDPSNSITTYIFICKFPNNHLYTNWRMASISHSRETLLICKWMERHRHFWCANSRKVWSLFLAIGTSNTYSKISFCINFHINTSAKSCSSSDFWNKVSLFLGRAPINHNLNWRFFLPFSKHDNNVSRFFPGKKSPWE